MIRGTTPTLTFDLGIPTKDIQAVVITLEQKNPSDRLSAEDVVINRSQGISIEKTSVSITLTQEETLAFHPNETVHAQVKIKDKAGHVLASNLMRINVEDILNQETI